MLTRPIMLAAAAVPVFCGLSTERSLDAAEPDSELPLLVEEDFESPNLSDWIASDPAAWRVENLESNHVFSQFQQSDQQTPVRSPFNRALRRGLVVTDFQLDVDLRSTARDYPHRSLCLFFGYQDPAHFYYVHLGQQADDHANQIFIVNEAPRTEISERTTEGTPWDEAWHHVRITRRVETGEISVYFDDLDAPVMVAADGTFSWGLVGIGSFDDTGTFDNFVIYGRTRN